MANIIELLILNEDLLPIFVMVVDVIAMTWDFALSLICSTLAPPISNLNFFSTTNFEIKNNVI